jgi:hypothetical protein
MRNKLTILGLFLAASGVALSCEIDTKLSIKGGNPPTFVVTGNGSLRAVRVRGPKAQRKAEGESAFIYWYFRAKGDGAKSVDEVGSVTYGHVPDGYVQVYPLEGYAPQLAEGVVYYVRFDTANANGADGVFVIRNGKAKFAERESELDEN